MTKLSSTFVMVLLSGILQAQVANVNATGDVKVEPGVTNYFSVDVKNIQKVAIIRYQSDYLVTMIYKGSTNAGRVLNQQINLGNPLDPGDTRNFRFAFTGPTLPGEYEVEIVLKWGSKVVSNIEKVTLVVAPKYEVSITAKISSFYVERGGTRDIDLRFNVENTGQTAWPEGKYNLDFTVVSTPSGASKYDRDAFSIDPKSVELWDLEPGASDEYIYQDFKPPYTDGSYVVRVTLMLNGKAFEADGNGKNITFKIDVK